MTGEMVAIEGLASVASAVEGHASVMPGGRSISTHGRTGDSEPERCLPDGIVHLWTTNLSDSPAETEELLRTLHEDERRRAAGIRAEKRRRQFIHGRALVRSLLARYLDFDAAERIRFEILPHGKPVARVPTGAGEGLSAEVHFNLSHAGELIAAAFSGSGPVGLDLEAIRSIAHTESIARGYFTDNERAWLESMPNGSAREHAFLSLWTCKEAVAKATGHGISAGWHEFEIARDGQGARAVPIMIRGGSTPCDAGGAPSDARDAADGGAITDGWTLIHPPIMTGYIATIAVRGPAEVSLFEWPNEKRTR